MEDHMSDELKHVKDHEHRVIRPAPHPKGGEINPKEYYMVDSPNGQWISQPGRTHLVLYWLDKSGFEPVIRSSACETMAAAERMLAQHCSEFVSFSPEEVIKSLEKTIEKVRGQVLPGPDQFQGMPYCGETVWVIHPTKGVVSVTVTEVADIDGKLSVVFGLHYKPNGEWFWSEAEAEAYYAQPDAKLRAKNVFLG